MGVVRYIGDKLINLVANLGASRDKASHSGYYYVPLTDQELDAAYRTAWMPRKIIDIPALDATRNWRTWQAEKEQISVIEAEEKRLGVKLKILEAMTKARLFGGAAVYIGTGERDASLPLRPEAVRRGGIQFLTVIPRRNLLANELETDPLSPQYGLPKSYTSHGGAVIHPSRLIRFVGNQNPDEELATGTNHGWGDSVLQSILDTVKQADGTAANIASLVFEAKVDVIAIPDLMNLLEDPETEKRITERFRMASLLKGNNATLLLDAEEKFETKQLHFASLTDILMSFLQLVSGASDIPVTRLLGQSPGGLNASGETDTRNYYDRVRSIQELTVTPAMGLFDECLIRSALGSRPPEVWYQWSSLWQTTDKERADIGKTTADTIKTLSDTRLFPDDALLVAATNMLVESGVMPGLDQAIEDAPEDDPDDRLAAANRGAEEGEPEEEGAEDDAD